ncbi:MAG: hypothetical protein KBA28_09990 [Syntrophaceae bacterium]|nr:hypothetical protein [Syntrophaceae bacterium]
MIDVKLTMPSSWPIFNQTPGRKGVWKECRFFCNTDVERCDYWFVLEGFDRKKDSTVCPKEHIVLITCEPPTLKTYKREYLQQFAAVITCHEHIHHSKPIFRQQGLPWHIGRKQKGHVNKEFIKDYDELKAMSSIPKTKLLSVISSDKLMSEGHRRRFHFAQKLKAHFGEAIDLFGRGLNEIEDKWDALASYRYHVALENSSVNHYWTEKLSDAFLAGCYPIYYGCPNINDYFSPDSLTPIDIDDPEKAIGLIENCLLQNRYELSEKKIWESRGKVLDCYNLFDLIAGYIAEDQQTVTNTFSRITLRKEPSDSNLFYRFKKKFLGT